MLSRCDASRIGGSASSEPCLRLGRYDLGEAILYLEAFSKFTCNEAAWFCFIEKQRGNEFISAGSDSLLNNV